MTPPPANREWRGTTRGTLTGRLGAALKGRGQEPAWRSSRLPSVPPASQSGSSGPVAAAATKGRSRVPVWLIVGRSALPTRRHATAAVGSRGSAAMISRPQMETRAPEKRVPGERFLIAASTAVNHRRLDQSPTEVSTSPWSSESRLPVARAGATAGQAYGRRWTRRRQEATHQRA